MIWREIEHSADSALGEGDLKICDLCGALNLAENPECHACTWHGHFDRRRDTIRMALAVFRRQFGPLRREHLLFPGPVRSPLILRLIASISGTLGRLRRWLFG